jgi:hypothetical protein
MSLNATDEPFESYLFYVQKRGDGALTPAEKTTKLEAENARLREELEDMHDRLRNKAIERDLLT